MFPAYNIISIIYLQDVRQKHLTASSLKDIFESVNNENVIAFMKDTHFYNSLYHLLLCFIIAK